MPASLPSTTTYRSSPGRPRLFASRAVTLCRLTTSSFHRTSALGAWTAGTRKTRYTGTRTRTFLLSVHSSSCGRVKGRISRNAPTMRNAMPASGSTTHPTPIPMTANAKPRTPSSVRVEATRPVRERALKGFCGARPGDNHPQTFLSRPSASARRAGPGGNWRDANPRRADRGRGDGRRADGHGRVARLDRARDARPRPGGPVRDPELRSLGARVPHDHVLRPGRAIDRVRRAHDRGGGDPSARAAAHLAAAPGAREGALSRGGGGAASTPPEAPRPPVRARGSARRSRTIPGDPLARRQPRAAPLHLE